MPCATRASSPRTSCPSTGGCSRALELDGRLRVVDALYVALAERRDCPLLTRDRRLAGAGLPCEVIVAE